MAKFNSKLTNAQKENIKKRFDTGRIYMAEVMDVRNTSRAGELLVYIIDSGLNKNDSRNWIVACYASNFYGTTPSEKNSSPDYARDPKSFGSWFPMPCVGNYVFIFFPVSSGENNNAYWFACPVNPNANYMLPGIPGKYQDENDHSPLCERNEKTYSGIENKIYNSQVLEGQTKQDVYKPLSDALIRQGLANDDVRGYSSAGAKRESPSMCYGILTPMGNSFVIDDGWSLSDNKTVWKFMGNDTDKLDDGDINQKRKLVGDDGKSPWQRTYLEEQEDDYKRHDAGFRLRTRNGTQILIADEGTIYMINADGTCWVEMTKNGFLEGFSKQGISMSSEGDINLFTTGNILMQAGKNIAMKSEGINIETLDDINIAKTKHINTEASISATEILAENGNISTLESNGAQLVGTFSGTLDGTAYYASYSGLIPTPQPAVVPEKPKLIKPEEQKKNEIQVKENLIYPDVINTKITSEEPYIGHEQSAELNEMQDNISTPLPESMLLSVERQKSFAPSNYCGGCDRSIGNNSRDIKGNDGATNQVCKNPAVNTVDQTPVGDEIPDIMLSTHFSLRQLCYSDTANANHIKNIPSQEVIENLKLLAENILEKVYNGIGKGKVQINSGFRNQRVNALVKSKNTSQHTTGQACDIEVPGTSTWDLCQWIRENCTYDQLILENCTNLSRDPNSGWVHVSYSNVENRKQKLTIRNGKSIPGLHR